jgi:hypothetical protein
MAETAQSVIKDALQELLVQASEQPIEANEFQSGVRYLNRMMATIPYNGLGYTNVVDPSDPITIDDGAIDGVIFSLALKLAPQYDIEPSNDLRVNKRDAMKSLRKLSLVYKPTQMPSTMPIGSGNEDWFTGRLDDHFYNPVNIPDGAQQIKTGEIDSFSVDFTNYLLEGATIASFTISSNNKVSVLSSAEVDGVITFSAEGLQVGHGTVCITITTSTGRVNPETVDFEVTKGCS